MMRRTRRTGRGLGVGEPWNPEDCTMYGTNFGEASACVERNNQKYLDYMNGPGYAATHGGVSLAQQIANENQQTALLVQANPSLKQYNPVPVSVAFPNVVPASVSTANAQQNTTQVNAQFQLINTTRGGSGSFTVGDGFTVKITGAAPNSTINVSSTQNGTNHGSATYRTDSNGNFSTSGVMDASTIGNWSETWSVGGQSFTSSFSVATPATNQTGQQNQTTNPTGLAPTENNTYGGSSSVYGSGTDTTVQPSGGFMSDFGLGLSELFSPSNWGLVFGSGSVGAIAGLLTVPALAYWMFSKKGRR